MKYHPHCWARRGSDGAMCDLREDHSDGGEHINSMADDAEWWPQSACAPNAGPDDRETAALRILELHHRADLLAFQEGLPVDDRLRAIAARLLAGTQAAAADHESILNDYTMDGSLWGTPRRAELWLAAADLLKPWIGAT